MQIYHAFTPDNAVTGSIVVRLYHSSDQVRGYVREVAGLGTEDAIFPGEEMEPEPALRLARDHARNAKVKQVYVELAEGLQWDNAWGVLV
ncbi:hypothetical protein ATY81_22460 [Rhizobium sp. R72]|uniref:hypothetical protein n=1 Tax=unclassified Rhizobium TaxID=2613769 RepID=UPI000B52AD42|nr:MULTISPECIES: hypothetical protein [unclassified Rhizobium]OWW02426.1 hypothetical protein ATY81_22460 [Rhizobium sp. R72]OWW02560.1 hypothetical protein ATY80_22460 [Rhizobium sp. R711]